LRTFQLEKRDYTIQLEARTTLRYKRHQRS